MNKNLTAEEFEKIFDSIINLEINNLEIRRILLELNQNNLPLNAFVGAIKSLKKCMKTINAPNGAIDVCGTGGDKLNTLNISTAVCFVVAAGGVIVAKHGNKAISSNSGSADIFSELGIKISSQANEIEHNLQENKLCFLFAPFFHESLKNIAQIRRELGVPTIFNFLGPLLNPANTKLQMIGVSRRDVMKKMLTAIHDPSELEQKIYIVHGIDGMDEISLSGDSYLLRLENGKIFDEELINPEKYGFKKTSLENIKGKDPRYNSEKLVSLLDGDKSAYRDIVILNSAFAFKVANKVNKVEDGIELAKSVIDDGSAKKILGKLIK